MFTVLQCIAQISLTSTLTLKFLLTFTYFNNSSIFLLVPFLILYDYIILYIFHYASDGYNKKCIIKKNKRSLVQRMNEISVKNYTFPNKARKFIWEKTVYFYFSHSLTKSSKGFLNSGVVIIYSYFFTLTLVPKYCYSIPKTYSIPNPIG